MRLSLYVGKQRGIRLSISCTPRATDTLQSLALLAIKRCGIESIRIDADRGSKALLLSFDYCAASPKLITQH